MGKYGISKQYLQYEGIASFGLIGTGSCIQFLVRYNEIGKFAATAACEDVFIWNIRTGKKESILNSLNRSLVNTLEVRPSVGGTLDNSHIAVGYADGLVSVFDIRTGIPFKFKAFQKGVSSLSWDKQGMSLACGSVDGEILVWDMISQMGIVRLKGHKGMINKLQHMDSRNVLVSSSRDTLVKFWDLDTNHCFYTLTGNNAEVIEFVLIKNDSLLLTGCTNGALTAWGIDFDDDPKVKIKDEPNDDYEDAPSQKYRATESGEAENVKSKEDIKIEQTQLYDVVKVERKGEMARWRRDRILSLVSDGKTVVSLGKSAFVDFYTILDDDEVENRRQKRLSKARKRDRESGTEKKEEPEPITINDQICKMQSLNAGKTISAVDVHTSKDGQIRILCLYKSENYIKSVIRKAVPDNKSGDSPYAEEHIVARPAHRKEVKVAAFNSTADELITASGDSIMVWHRGSNDTVTQIEANAVLSMIIPPGDKHVIVGLKSGKIELFDLRRGESIQCTHGHDASDNGDSGVFALDLWHDKRGFVSGGSDAVLKFWSFELVTENDIRRLAFMPNEKSVRTADAITTVRCSANGKHVIAATIDMTETIYYIDTLNVCHQLYGKPMIATCVDFSSDSSIVVTGSRDSCLRIYDVNHGDLKKLLKNAHTGGVLDLRFIPKTHIFFSCGADGKVKQWDADHFQRIFTLHGHFGIVRCLAIDYRGHWVASSGQDRSIRLWEKTEIPLRLEDEREEERQAEEDVGVLEKVVIGEKTAEAVRPSIMTQETERAVDNLAEAIDIFLQQKEEMVEPNQIMTMVYNTKDPLKFMLLVLQKLKSSEIDETLLMLPLNYVIELLYILQEILQKNWDVELPCRIAIFAIRINMNYLLASPKARPVLKQLAELVPNKLMAVEDEYNFIIAGLTHMKERYERTNDDIYSETIEKVLKKRNKRSKRK